MIIMIKKRKKMKILNKKIIEIIDFIYLFVRNFNIIY